ncbi:MAG: threonine/serine dehydratase [Gemmatimonadetes bacterium]|nr:threonine/serine dehydratase [Gemmatimonadota bacterium]
MPSSLVTIEDIRRAAESLRGVAVRTPLTEVAELSRIAGFPVYLKHEQRQPTGAFKLRGAWNAVSRLAPDVRNRGVITYSSGNHGQALAFAAQRMGIRAVIVMPETTPAAKVDGVKKWGGEAVLVGTTSEHRYARAQEIAARDGLSIIPPFDHPDIIAGQGTIGLEILEELPDVAVVAVPIGGGGMAAGVTTVMAALRPGAKVYAVEPEGAAGYAAAVKAGKPVRLTSTASVADGLLPLSVGALTFKHLFGRAEPVTVSDTAIVEATRWLHFDVGLTVEPSGAATTAALRSGRLRVTGPTVLVVSGGNIDPARIPDLKPVAA